MEITTTELLNVVNLMWEAQEKNFAAFQATLAHYERTLGEHERERQAMQDEIDRLKTKINFGDYQECLERGLLPPLDVVSLLECQIFHKPTITAKQRQGGHTEWSLRLRAGVGGRKLAKELNVALHAGPVFAGQVRNTFEPIPATIAAIAEHAAQQNSGDILYGMFKQYTSGEGSPRSRRQFAVLFGHLTDEPHVQVWSDEVHRDIDQWRPGAGSKPGHAKWWGCAGKATL